MKKIKESDTAISGINVVPIIDVCLVLLVILFIMTPVLNINNVPINLPEAMTKETKDQNITVSMSSDGQISIDSQMVSVAQTGERLRAALKGRTKTVVVVRADKSLAYGPVENLIKLVNRNAGDNAVAIATKQRTATITAGMQR